MANKKQAQLQFKEGYGKNLKALRESKHLTLKELGDKLHYSDKTIGHIETEQRTPTIEQINTYSDYFGASLDYITGRSSVENGDLKNACDITGLSESTVMYLSECDTEGLNFFNAIASEFVELLAEVEPCKMILKAYDKQIAELKAKSESTDISDAQRDLIVGTVEYIEKDKRFIMWDISEKIHNIIKRYFEKEQ